MHSILSFPKVSILKIPVVTAISTFNISFLSVCIIVILLCVATIIFARRQLKLRVELEKQLKQQLLEFSQNRELEQQENELIQELNVEPNVNAKGSSILDKKPLILLIEDNDEMRTYLHDNLKQDFTVLEAANGKEGWQKTLFSHPNLIVSDVNMPEMNGIDLCKKIKSDKRTTHIPIILLTAIGDEYSQISGLEGGANDYIVKPFNSKILISKMHSLLAFKDTLKKTYQKQVNIQVKEMTIESEDDKFVDKLISVVNKNISNPNFSVEELSSTMAMSRVALYKKILSITGKTPVEFIRKIKLQKAVQLLEKSKLSIARVSYDVGYSNPNYFAKVFREEYNMLPSEYIASIAKDKLKETSTPNNN